MLAGFLYAQLEIKDIIQAKREKLWNYYFINLSDWAKENDIRLPFVPEYCEQSYHMFYLLFPNKENRTKFIRIMKKNNITCVFHYLPLNKSIMGNKFGWMEGDCPVSEDISERIVRLPFYNNLFSHIDYVIDNILKIKF